MTDYAELRAALDAGPTGGEWGIGDSDLPVSHLSIHAVDGQRHSTIARMVKSEHRVWCAGEFVATWKFIAAANPDVIRDLLAERDHYATECQEQARLLGMSAERELKLIAEREALRKTLADIAAYYPNSWAADQANAALAQEES